MMEEGLWVILLEAGVALGLLLGIVWATWPKGKHGGKHNGKPDVARPDNEEKTP
jgi:hypothetical protein